MRSLQGLLKSNELSSVRDKTRLMFRNADEFRTPEAVVVHEQNLISDEELLKACSEEYNKQLCTPRREYIPRDIVDKFKGLDCVPLFYNSSSGVMTVAVLPERPVKRTSYGSITVKSIEVPIYYYVDIYRELYGQPDFLLPLPARDYLDFIFSEAISLKAADITIYNDSATTADVIYNVRKRLVHSNRSLEGDMVLQLAHTLAASGSAEFDEASTDPRFFSIRVDMHNRGRVVVNKTYHGWCITIRVLPDDYLNTTLEQLNIKQNTCDFIRRYVLSDEKGLRLFIGETMSGKNTTILAALMELVGRDRYKIVSVENPVEILVRGIIQIDADTEELFAKNADSLLRQNPDIVYFTEITEKTAYSIIKQSNTSKAVFSSVHANSVADVISRLMDITGVDSDRVVQTLQSCVYQVLVRDDEHDRVYPVNRCVHFDDELKSRLYGLPLYEKQRILKEEEDKWIS